MGSVAFFTTHAISAQALLLIVAMGPSKFFHSPFYVLDIVVVTASIIFDFTDDHHREAGLLILPRLWRCARIIHGVYVVGHMEVPARRMSDGALSPTPQQN